MKTEGFKEFVLDQLRDLRGVTCRAMFGGFGLYHRKSFFGIIHKDRLYFKTDEISRSAYLKQGMKPFRPNAKQTLTSYYEVPVDILEDADQLTGWAKTAAKAST